MVLLPDLWCHDSVCPLMCSYTEASNVLLLSPDPEATGSESVGTVLRRDGVLGVDGVLVSA